MSNTPLTLAFNRREQTDQLMQEGRVLVATGDYTAALAKFEAALESTDSIYAGSAAKFNIALCLYRQNQNLDRAKGLAVEVGETLKGTDLLLLRRAIWLEAWISQVMVTRMSKTIEEQLAEVDTLICG